MLLASNLPKNLWGYAILNANYIKNHMHTRALPDKTPYKVVHQKKPNLRETYEWGRDVYVKITQHDKLQPQAKAAKWIGHSSQSDGHCIYWPDSYKVSIERNIILDTVKEPSLAPILPDESQDKSIDEERRQ